VSLIVTNSETKKSIFRWQNVLVSVITCAVFVTLLILGNWQVQRLSEKESLLANIEQRFGAPDAPSTEIINAVKNGANIEYRPVTVTGMFDHNKERHFFATHNGYSGYYVYTPMITDNGTVFINRGFVPFDLKEAETRLEGQIDGEVTIIGLARSMLDERPSSIVPDNDPDKNQFFWKDLRVMASSTGLDFDNPSLLRFFIDVNDAPNLGGYPQGGVTLIDLPNNHLQYAVTWYGLAGALFVVIGFFLFRKKA
jgi:surfeit locus 1 family protein